MYCTNVQLWRLAICNGLAAIYSLYEQTTKLLKAREKGVHTLIFCLYYRHLKSTYSLRVITTILGFTTAFDVDSML